MAREVFESFVEPVRGRQEEFVERIVAWASINSGSRNPAGVARMAQVMCAELEELTREVCTIPFPPEAQLRDDGTTVFYSVGPGVRARKRPEAPVQILFNGHLDTVFGEDHHFQQVRREGDRLIGPGVVDMKGGLLVMIEALRILESAPFAERIGWEVILNSDEEIGSPCSAALLAEAAPRFDVGLVFEPALPNGDLVSERLGTGTFLIRVQGRSAHVGREYSAGRSATVALAELVTRLHRFNDEPGVIVNVGRIGGGGPSLNIVPAEAFCRLNVRIDSEEKAREVTTKIGALVAELDRRDGFAASLHGGIARSPKRLTPEIERLLHEFRTSARELGFELGWAPTGGASDGNILAAAGLPTVDNLGVRGGGMHTENEFLEIGSVIERISLCARFLLKVARGDVELPSADRLRPV